MIERRGIFRKIGAKNIQVAITIVVIDRHAHPGLCPPLFVVSHSSHGSNVGESPVTIVVIKDARSAVTGNVDIGPTVFVVIESGGSEAVMTCSVVNVSRCAHVLEPAVANIME